MRLAMASIPMALVDFHAAWAIWVGQKSYRRFRGSTIVSSSHLVY